jgi:hypothetical protein
VITVRCNTRFDITATGVLGQYKENRQAHNHADGSVINDHSAWIKARNQQRNWETFNQIISLRCLPENITLPQRDIKGWWFDFDVENSAALCDKPNDVAFLISDAHGVPVIVGLDEDVTDAVIRSQGPDPNTVFQVLHDKYPTGEQ